MKYLADQPRDHLLSYFSKLLFAPNSPPNLTPQDRGNLVELVVALRFCQGWWKESIPKLRKYLPKNISDIDKPLGILDARKKSNPAELNFFLQHIHNKEFPYVILPSGNAKPDVSYNIFNAHLKTCYSNKSQTSYVSAAE